MFYSIEAVLNLKHESYFFADVNCKKNIKNNEK